MTAPDQPTAAPCSVRYPSTDPTARIVHCGLPQGHDGDHAEEDGAPTWPMPDQPCHLAGMHPADCPAYVAGMANLRERVRAAASWSDATTPDQPSYRAVAGERPCGDPACVCAGSAAPAIAVLPPSMATHTPATFNRAYELGRAAGVAEGRRQATEGWDREWAVTHVDGGWVYPYGSEAEARAHCTVDWHRVVSRLVGPWEAAEQDGDGR